MSVRIVYNMKAFKQIRHAAGAYVEGKGQLLRSMLPDGYSLIVQRKPSTQRPRAIVSALTPEARKDDAENARLLKAASALRGT